MNGPASEALDALLVAAFRSYRQGLRRLPQCHAIIPYRDFDALRFLGTIGWAPLEERLLLRHLHIECFRGLTAARRDLLTEASSHYLRAEEILQRLEARTRLAWLMGVSTYQSGLAYLEFRRGQSDRAYERLNDAMNADLELELAGLPVMQMHRIQQGHNFARIYIRLERRAAAMKLCGSLFAYLERRVDTLPFHHHWRSRHLQAVPRSLVRVMIHQIIAETAGQIVTGNDQVEEWSTLIEACRLCSTPEKGIFPQVEFALLARRGLLEGNHNSYLLNLERFFSLGIRHCHLLWYPVMAELVSFCREIVSSHSNEVLNAILRDSTKWKGVPHFLRDRFEDTTRRAVALPGVRGEESARTPQVPPPHTSDTPTPLPPPDPPRSSAPSRGTRPALRRGPLRGSARRRTSG